MIVLVDLSVTVVLPFQSILMESFPPGWKTLNICVRCYFLMLA